VIIGYAQSKKCPEILISGSISDPVVCDIASETSGFAMLPFFIAQIGSKRRIGAQCAPCEQVLGTCDIDEQF
jgi:hypothetical protein